MPFPTSPALEKAVVADAENDLPRLVYADWLEEHGDPARAAFIRAQVGLWDKNPADPDYPDLVEARREAFDRMNGRDNLSPKLPAAVGFHDILHDADRDDFHRGYQRGFPYIVGEPTEVRDEVKAADRFRAALPKLLATSTVRGFKFYGWFSGQLARILSAPECGRFTALAAGDHTPVADELSTCRVVARSPMAGSLHWLEAPVRGVADAEVLADADFPHLRRWHVGYWHECPKTAVKRVGGSGWFRGLHRVNCPFPADLAPVLWPALAAAPDLHTVEGWCEAGGLTPLAIARPFRSLGRLQMNLSGCSADDLAALARARFPNLAVFEAGGRLRNDGLKRLTAADWFAGLRVLYLSSEEVGDQGVAALGRTPTAGRLRSLNLRTPKLGKKAFASLARDFPDLTTLNLRSTHKKKATPANLAPFAAGLTSPRLRDLNLSGWPLGDAGAVALANNPALANLTRLALRYTALGDRGTRAVLTSPHLQRLVYLDLDGCAVGGAVTALADPAVLPELAECWLPREVDRKAFDKLVKARGRIFIGGPI